ncbi:UNVERIFIED_CONTAM: hypothetical protein K2H54_059120 [Gekko kuhli]
MRGQMTLAAMEEAVGQMAAAATAAAQAHLETTEREAWACQAPALTQALGWWACSGHGGTIESTGQAVKEALPRLPPETTQAAAWAHAAPAGQEVATPWRLQSHSDRQQRQAAKAKIEEEVRIFTNLFVSDWDRIIELFV